MVEKVLG